MTDGLLVALIYCFVLTFICYPGLAADNTTQFLESVNNYSSWHILLIQGIFNFFDTVGRYCGGLSCLTLSNSTIKLMSGLRTLFLALFLLTSFDVTGFFESDWFTTINLLLFSISNGYVSTLCAVKAPQTVEGEAKGQVGGFVGITISSGIVIGSILAFIM